ncbi:MAG TPA: MAPEG family protein [Xanthobacteraceae bacterium]|nr:MAPEG family protein [Xanthobacteraceae bacterium]
MSVQMILLPLFVEVILTFALLFWLAPLRAGDFRSGLREEDIALRQPNWSKPALQVQYSFSNQFELPVLFYVLTILAYVTHHAGTLCVVLAWVFVIFRLLQAYVHVTNNKVRLRGMFFGISALALAIMWIVFIIQILTGT